MIIVSYEKRDRKTNQNICSPPANSRLKSRECAGYFSIAISDRARAARRTCASSLAQPCDPQTTLPAENTFCALHILRRTA